MPTPRPILRKIGVKTRLKSCTAIMLDFMRTHTGPVGTWTAEHYAMLKAELDEWADSVRHSLDKSLS